MFKNRKLTVKVEKETKKPIQITPDTKTFEQKTEYVMKKIERFGVKVFAGVCIYVALDTARKCAVQAVENQE